MNGSKSLVSTSRYLLDLPKIGRKTTVRSENDVQKKVDPSFSQQQQQQQQQQQHNVLKGWIHSICLSSSLIEGKAPLVAFTAAWARSCSLDRCKEQRCHQKRRVSKRCHGEGESRDRSSVTHDVAVIQALKCFGNKK